MTVGDSYADSKMGTQQLMRATHITDKNISEIRSFAVNFDAVTLKLGHLLLDVPSFLRHFNPWMFCGGVAGTFALTRLVSLSGLPRCWGRIAVSGWTLRCALQSVSE